MKKNLQLISGICAVFLMSYSAKAQSTETFNFTGSEQTWTVPTGVTSLQVVAKGAKGGNGNDAYNPNSPGGKGGTVSATLTVTAGSTLYIYVGGQGKSGQYASPIANATRAFNGGGLISGYNGNGTGNGGGGGATDIRIGGNALSNRVLVAGGGGGGVIRSDQRAGGAGGGLVGGAGQDANAGQGGTQIAGGAGGSSEDGNGNSGLLGIGGDAFGGGGGGGGYYGGGGGVSDFFGFPPEYGGGGGSSYTDPAFCADEVHTQGDNNGDGVLTITYSAVLPIELIKFTGKTTKGENLLIWQTANEVNNKGFQIERLASPTPIGGEVWDILGFKTANNKSSTYDFTDNTPLRISYYRLRQLDNDGKETLSKVISVSSKGSDKLKVYPNPVSDVLTIETEMTGDFEILNLLGQQVLSGKAAQRINVSALPQGTYFLKIGAEQVKFIKY